METLRQVQQVASYVPARGAELANPIGARLRLDKMVYKTLKNPSQISM
jgi:hypothetical protein